MKTAQELRNEMEATAAKEMAQLETLADNYIEEIIMPKIERAATAGDYSVCIQLGTYDPIIHRAAQKMQAAGYQVSQDVPDARIYTFKW